MGKINSFVGNIEKADSSDNTAAVNSRVNAAGLEWMMDMERIGIMGHSFGGATAFDASYTDDRLKAGIDMDGTVCGSTMKFTQSKY
ncbi:MULTISPECIES: hypothetical protein [Paenibacillus]|uniref:alpha/beta hydrolase n=1 Tax=Paenibacillus TaxID=44249 RepID=UPI000A0761D1|nr:hypothetical protein [Paenibacillus sp. PSB04]UYO07394.1 hypothetical protein K2F33_01385 [Paenibacillus sp. PSB04]